MRTSEVADGVAVIPDDGDSQELLVIAQKIMPEWLAMFARKNRDYGSGSAYELGVRGQYSDIHRKMIKLKRAMWDGEQLDFENTDEIIKDLISHLFLTLHMFGLQREAEQAYVYTEDDAAVDQFFRMVGGNPEDALKMSGVLQHPFRDMVRDRAHKILEDEQAEHRAAIAADVQAGKPVPSSVIFHEVLSDMRADGATRGRAWEGARTPRRRPNEADGSPGEAAWAAARKARSYGVRDEGDLDGFSSSEFAESDQEQHSVVVGYNFEGETAGARTGRIISEMMDGRVHYYHEAHPGSDREPLALVPKALIERAQKDQHVMSSEQAAGLRILQDWVDNS